MPELFQRKIGTRGALPFLGIACAVGVASIYYNQPLLMIIGREFGVDARATSFVALATQVGYALGILFFVPLGDITDRRKLMLRMYAGVSVALLLAAAAQSLAWLIAASVLIGVMAAVTHVALPMAPDLVPAERRGQAIGVVMTGLLLGILLARTFAGWIARFSSWRMVFVIAAVMNLAFVPILMRWMPAVRPKNRLPYAQTLASLWTLFRAEPLLREAAVLGALTFASFSCFWTTLAYLLHEQFHLGSDVAGMFGIVGAAGALIAPFAGSLADRRGPRFVLSIAGGVLTLAYLVLWMNTHLSIALAAHMAVMMLGVLLLDIGAQMMQVGNQTRIFGLDESARSRLNTIYMTFYFAGGALGSALAGQAWSRWQWDGVSVLSLSLLLLAAVRHWTGRRESRPNKVVSIRPDERRAA